MSLLNTSQAWFAMGSGLWVGDGGSPEAFDYIPAMMDISGPSITAATTDVTVHDNVDGYAQFISTLKDGGTVSFNLVWDPTDSRHNAGNTGLLGLLESRVTSNMRHTFPTSPTTRFRFRGVVVKYSPTAPVKGALTASVDIKVSGKPTLETGTGNGA
jgi:hypothetical protein